ncbi:MAG TPA: hypothetical protein VHR45_09155 [Thermoanaerobaculia bacterium]|nr:hypothetical protein [Thermoanaerobaculia bacterium]
MEKIWYLLGVTALFFATALLIVVLRTGTALIAGWAFLALQLVLLIPLAVLALLLVLWLADEAPKRMRAVSREYAPEVKAFRKHSPALLASVGLIGEGIATLAHHGLGDEKDHAAAITGIVLLIGFWIANHLLASSSGTKRILGWLLWPLLLLFFPVAVILHRGTTVPQFFRDLNAMDIGSKAFWALALLALLIVPFATLDERVAEVES